MEDLEYIAWLIAESERCLPEETTGRLTDLSLEALEGDLPCLMEVFRVDGFTVCIPLCQLPEAWANLVHVICSHDYDRLQEYRPRRGWAVVDGGAYLGFYSLYAASLGATVYAFEPNPEARAAIRCGAAESGLLGRVYIDHHALCGPGDRLVRLHVTRYWATSSGLPGYAESMGEVSGVVDAACTWIGEAARYYQLESINLLKLDVEGMELRVLQGLRSSEAPVERVVVEVHPGFVEPGDVVEELRAAGYRVDLVHAVSESQVMVYASLRA